jgi:hypothetical protein
LHDFSDDIMRPNNSMIPKSCRLSGYDHATEQDHDPEKSPDFSGQSLRLKNAPAKIAEAWAAAGPLRTAGGGGRDLSPICEASAEG